MISKKHSLLLLALAACQPLFSSNIKKHIVYAAHTTYYSFYSDEALLERAQATLFTAQKECSMYQSLMSDADTALKDANMLFNFIQKQALALQEEQPWITYPYSSYLLFLKTISATLGKHVKKLNEIIEQIEKRNYLMQENTIKELLHAMNNCVLKCTMLNNTITCIYNYGHNILPLYEKELTEKQFLTDQQSGK